MPQRSRLARLVFAWGLTWVLAGSLYLLLIDTTDLPELIVAAGAAMIAATGLELAREQRIAGESFRPGWLRRSYRVIARVPVDIALLSAIALRALVRPQPSFGRFRAVKFTAGGEDPLDSGRRGLALAIGSVAPNTIVVGVDPERQEILAHQLRPTRGREAIDPLELG